MEDDYKKACGIVIKMLSKYPKTVFEVEKKLRQKNFKDDVIKKTINYFLERKLLSDDNYALLWLENQLKYRPTSRIFCKRKMLSRGLASDLIDKVLEKNYPAEKELDIAYKLAKKKLGEVENKFKDKKAKILRIGQYLDRKGFSENIVWNVLEKLGLLN